MKTHILTLSVLLFIIAGSMQAQQPDKNRVEEPKDRFDPVQINRIQPLENAGSIRGDHRAIAWETGAYLNPEFREGIIIMNDGNRISDKRYRYNLYTQQMQYIEGPDTLAIANPEQVALIRIGGDVFVYDTYLCEGQPRSGYLQLLQDGDCRLLKRWQAAYHQSEQEGAGVDCQNDHFYKTCNCLLQFNNMPAEPVSGSKREFIKSFGTHADRVHRFMRKEKFKHNDQDDLQQIVMFYNTLNE